jgi:ADP-ribosyl-[dinitrogen reductase] hydrolase
MTFFKAERRNFPIDFPHEIVIDLSFDEAQYQKLILGLSAKEMEDRWRIKFENDTLFFQRSWTGYTIFEAKIHKENNRYYIYSFYAERNPEKYKITDDAYDVEAINRLMKKIIEQ